MKVPARYTSRNKSFDGGGMSNAHLYGDENLERDVVIKNLMPGADPKRLLDEIKSLSAIRSKHVVELYDIIKDEAGSVCALIEEFVAGPDLNAKVGKVLAQEALAIGYSIARGLSDIHEHGQIHRDIKPNNMKFDAEGCLKIFDFGLAREDVDAATVGLIGTFGYIAPELCVGAKQKAKFTKAVDVFAFASVMLKLLHGSIPKPLRAIPPTLPCAEADFFSLAVKLPDPVCAMLNDCHSSDPNGRPTMDEVCHVFSAHMLVDRHRATLVVSGVVHLLHTNNRVANVSAGSMGSFTVQYDGLRFMITSTVGSIYVNNIPVVVPYILPGSCVITMGPPTAGMDRVYVPVDVSHPEVLA